MTSRYAMLLLLLIVLLTTCSKQSNNDTGRGRSSKNVECIEPHNSYQEGGGHYAGFEWAQENGHEDEGNSNSFHEGTVEYIRQLNEYNECMAKKR
jgi:hypothetical protein